MNITNINIGRDYCDCPIGRYTTDGPYSAERLREELLIPALKKYDKVLLNLDEVEGFFVSFLEEAFGGLIWKGILTPNNWHKKIELIAITERGNMYKRMIKNILHKIEEVEIAKTCPIPKIIDPAAFPQPLDDQGHPMDLGNNSGSSGMSLKDYFAGQALTGIIMHPQGKAGKWEEAAKDAYKLAEAMLKRRTNPEE